MSNIMIITTLVITFLTVSYRFLLLVSYKHARPEDFNKIILSQLNPNLAITVIDAENGKEISQVSVECAEEPNPITTTL